MASFGTSSWRVLHQDGQGFPSLLVKFASSHAGYHLMLTDLSHVWTEKLSAAQIATRADQDDCSINPGDDADQLGILLARLDSAFDCSQETAVRLGYGDSPDDLTLYASAPLPEPLEPLSWRMCLSRADATELTAAIISPLLCFAHQQGNELKSLLNQLTQKDHVISRLLDRMESANIHLDSVFLLPNLRVSKKISQRDQFLKHVPGLAAFRPQLNKKQVCDIPPRDVLVSVLERISHCDPAPIPIVPQHDWWHRIIDTSQGRIMLNPDPYPDLDGDDTEDEEFQTQEVPGRLQKPEPSNPRRLQTKTTRAKYQTQQVDEDAETTDEGGMSSPLPPPQGKALRPSSPLGLGHSQLPGTIGSGFKQLATKDKERDKTKSPSAAFRSSPPDAADRRIASPTPLLQDSLPATRYSQQTKGQSGSLGGRRTVSPTPSVSNSLPGVKTSPTKRRLGAIGGRQGSSQIQSQTPRGSSPLVLPSIEEENPMVRSQKTEAYTLMSDIGSSKFARHEEGETEGSYIGVSSRTRETSEERANRKREELRQQLDSRVKAPPKKKRRF